MYGVEGVERDATIEKVNTALTIASASPVLASGLFHYEDPNLWIIPFDYSSSFRNLQKKEGKVSDKKKEG